MLSEPAQRPTATVVRDHATWLTEAIEPEVAIPVAIDDESTHPMPSAPRVITSERSSNVSGEIHLD